VIITKTFENKSVLITGHTGFKGSWLTAWLHWLGANVFGVSLDTPSEPSHFEVAALKEFVVDNRIDIRDREALVSVLLDSQPDFVFHLAAQPLVRRSYAKPIETYQTNVLGTVNLLEALRLLKKPCVAVLITSDKCYDNMEWVWGYRETDRLGGADPYSASKGAAELIIRSYVCSFFQHEEKIRIGIGRAGNVIGGGDWAENRIVPDCVRSWAEGESAILRNPNSTRPWQHVLEPLSGYLTLAIALHEKIRFHGEPFNFGPSALNNNTVLALVQEMSRHWDQVSWKKAYNNEKKPYESGLLKLNCDKALHDLHWQAFLPFQETVRMTAEWYSSYYKNPLTIQELTFKQIQEYVQIAQSKEMPWAQ